MVDDETAILQTHPADPRGLRLHARSEPANGAEAVDFVDSGQAPVALVLTDMSMPVMDGASTAAYLLQRHPTIPVIAASG